MEELNEAFKRLQTKEQSLTETVVSYVGMIGNALEGAIVFIEHGDASKAVKVLKVTVSNIKRFERKMRPVL